MGSLMFIQTEVSSDPNLVKFLPGKTVLEGKEVTFSDPVSAARSPLASRLFDIESVAEVAFGADFIRVTKLKDGDWQLMKPAILGAIMEHYVADLPMILDSEADEEEENFDPDDSDIVAEIKELLSTRVRPAITESGGDIKFRGYREGRIIVEFSGSA